MKIFQHWRGLHNQVLLIVILTLIIMKVVIIIVFMFLFLDWKWLLLHAAMMFLPFVQCAYMTLNAVQLFVPIMGRTGAANNGELILSVLCAVMFNLLFSYIVSITITA